MLQRGAPGDRIDAQMRVGGRLRRLPASQVQVHARDLLDQVQAVMGQSMTQVRRTVRGETDPHEGHVPLPEAPHHVGYDPLGVVVGDGRSDHPVVVQVRDGRLEPADARLLLETRPRLASEEAPVGHEGRFDDRHPLSVIDLARAGRAFAVPMAPIHLPVSLTHIAAEYPRAVKGPPRLVCWGDG